MKSIYKQAKQILNSTAKQIKVSNKYNKPLVRIIINNQVHSLSKDLSLNEYQTNLLSDYACKLIP
jgi:hypothetical protein